MTSAILNIEGLTKSYPGLNRQVLAGLCLTMKQGEIYGISQAPVIMRLFDNYKISLNFCV